MIAIEEVFISEQIKKYWSGALIDISILQCRLNIFEYFITILYDFEKHIGYEVLLERS